jgi:sugar phosphate isomerase/epimerase
LTDRILFCSSRKNFDDCLKLAVECGAGMEIQAFAYPETLEDDWQGLVAQYQRALRILPGERAMHGPFIDMSSGTPDPLVRQVVRKRVMQSLDIADRLSVKTVVFHANFIAAIRNEAYRREWVGYMFDFWSPCSAR